MLSAEQLSEIVAAYADNKTQLNRRAPRVPHTARTTIYRPARTPQDTALAVQMRDVSARGCSFTVKEKLSRDSNFIIRFSRRDRPPVAVLCTVMHCRQVGDQYRIGAEFTCLLDLKRAATLAEQSGEELDRIRSSILG